MRLVKDLTSGARAIHVVCIGEAVHESSRMFRLADGYVDTQGPAFRAYYCKACGDALIAAGNKLTGHYVDGYGTGTTFEEAR